MINIAIESVIIGDRAGDSETFSPVELSLASELISVKDLIYRTVKKQIEQHLKKEKQSETVQQMFNRQYLSDNEIKKKSEEGAIQVPSQKKLKPALIINIDREYQRAINCFDGNIYKLLIDGETMEDLEQTISLTPKSKIIFIRLTPLIGG